MMRVGLCSTLIDSLEVNQWTSEKYLAEPHRNRR